jgi:putative protease
MDTFDRYIPPKGNYAIEEHDRPGEYLPIDEDEHGTYIMNSKDLCAIELLDKLINAGVNSFKIEGRTKSIYYLSIITRAYRHAIDEYYSGKSLDQKWKREVNAVANREYITGFLEKNPRQHGENYPNTHKNNQTHIFCGKVVKIENSTGKILISVHNRIEQGDELEVISPDNQFSIRVDRIYSVTGDLLPLAHGGGGNIYLDIPDLHNEYSIIRKPVRKSD